MLPPETSVEAINNIASRIKSTLLQFPYLSSFISAKLQEENISPDQLDAYLKTWETDIKEKQEWYATINARLDLLLNYLGYRAGDL